MLDDILGIQKGPPLSRSPAQTKRTSIKRISVPVPDFSLTPDASPGRGRSTPAVGAGALAEVQSTDEGSRHPLPVSNLTALLNANGGANVEQMRCEKSPIVSIKLDRVQDK